MSHKIDPLLKEKLSHAKDDEVFIVIISLEKDKLSFGSPSIQFTDRTVYRQAMINNLKKDEMLLNTKNDIIALGITPHGEGLLKGFVAECTVDQIIECAKLAGVKSIFADREMTIC